MKGKVLYGSNTIQYSCIEYTTIHKIMVTVPAFNHLVMHTDEQQSFRPAYERD